MPSPPLTDRRLVVVLGKGGVGKTTVAAALALGLADRGHRTLLIEVAAETRTAAVFGTAPPVDAPVEARPGLFALSVDAERAMQEYLSIQLKVRPLVEMMSRSRAFHQVTQAAPGLAELVTLGKIWDLATAVRDGRPVWDRLVVDAPATGHGLALLQAAASMRDLAGSGPISDQADAIERVVRHPAATGVVVVAIPEELAVTEATEAVTLMRGHGLPVACAVANAVRTSPFGPGDADALRQVRADPAAGSAERAAAGAALATVDGAAHDAREVRALGDGCALPVAVLPVVADLAPGSGGIEQLSAALMTDPALGGAGAA